MNNDDLFRVSVKAVIHDATGRVLVVKEQDDTHWNLPGGGMDHGETVRLALKRELYEEVAYSGEFTMELLAVEEAKPLTERAEPIWQLRLIYKVAADLSGFSVGEYASEIAFVDPIVLKQSTYESERRLYDYCVR